MIPAWLGIPGLVVLAIVILIAVVVFIVGTITQIQDYGFKSLLIGIQKDLLFILFIIILISMMVIGSLYLNQLLGI